MRITLLRQVMISGEPALAGSTLDLSAADATLLLSSGKAERAKAEEAAPPEMPAPSAEAEAKPTKPSATKAKAAKPAPQPTED
jgi:hypothetical protein